ncbi:MAG: histidine kinase N-terminal 7TM domain-containing protein [Candidatus Neomarinimicrobiota bacterium]
MNYHFNILSWILAAATFAGLYVAFAAWKRRTALNNIYFTLLEFSASLWAFAAIFEAAATTVALKLFWTQISYLGIGTVPLFYFLFALAYNQRYHYLTKTNILLLSIIPALTFIFVLTNDFHNLYYPTISINPDNIGLYSHGPLFWLYTTYAYILLLVSIIIFFQAIFRSHSYFKIRLVILLLGSALPMIGNLMYVFNLNPIPGLDWTPISFVISGIILSWGIDRFQMFDLVPVARNKLVDLMGDGVLVIDFMGRIADVNPAMAEILGTTVNKVVGCSAFEALADWPELMEQLHNNQSELKEVRRTNDSGERYFDLRRSVLLDHLGQFSGQLLILRDISRRKQAENTLRQSEARHRRLSEELGQANSMKELLLDVITHDLKNPAGVIRGFAEVLLENGSDRETLEYIYQSSNNLLKVIDNASILSGVTIGDEIRKEKLDLSELISAEIEELKSTFANSGITVDFQIAKPIPVIANPIIAEVFKNYFSNALKYAGSGKKIIVDCEREDDFVTINVKDFGQPIPRKEYDHIFTRRYQMQSQRGMGLGLAIAKKIAEAHSAVVGVKPNQPTGNIFYLKIAVIEN